MPWIVKDKEESEFFDSLRELPDRVAGLLVTTIIDDRLTEAIRAHWHDVKTDGEMLLGRLFNYSGPIGSFGTRIDIGFAIGLYDEESFRDLHTVRHIRNAFAHNLAPKDFSAQSVKDRAFNLRVPEKFPIIPRHEISSSGMMMTYDVVQMTKVMAGHSSIADISTARNRFIRAGELFSTLLFYASISVPGHETKRIPLF